METKKTHDEKICWRKTIDEQRFLQISTPKIQTMEWSKWSIQMAEEKQNQNESWNVANSFLQRHWMYTSKQQMTTNNHNQANGLSRPTNTHRQHRLFNVKIKWVRFLLLSVFLLLFEANSFDLKQNPFINFDFRNRSFNIHLNIQKQLNAN